MSEGFTPGPWKDGIEIPLKAISCERAGFALVFINTGSPKREEQAKANARLIASAPELLRALDDLLIAYCDPGNQGSDHDDKVEAARAAIAKARGTPC